MRTIDYMTKDYEGFRQLMIDMIPLIAPEWTDTTEDDFGIVIVELLSYGLDILSYYQDKVANEAFLPTARTRKSIINTCRYLLGYNLTPASPAQFLIVFTKITAFKDKEITINAGTLIGTDPALGSQIIFEVDKTITIPSGAIGDEKDSDGNYLYAVTATHGKTVRDSLGMGDGTANQKFNLSNASAILGTLTVWTEENNVIKSWDKVEDFMDSISSSRNFLANTNENRIGVLEFGDGSSGMVVPKGASLFSTYRIGGGTIGNVGIGKINSFVGSEIVGIGSITNPSQPLVKGVNEESLDSAKILAPKMFKANDRAVTASDFEVFACKVSGVLRAKCVETFNENGDVIVYIINTTGTTVPQELKDRVKTYLDGKKLINCNVIVEEGQFLDYDLTINIKTLPQYSNQGVQALIETKTSSLLDITKFDFEGIVKKSSIITEINKLTQVDDIEILAPTSNVEASSIQVPRLNKLSVNVSGGVES